MNKIENMRYNSDTCSECKKPLTKQDRTRKNRKLLRPFIEDCEKCETKQINKLNNETNN